MTMVTLHEGAEAAIAEVYGRAFVAALEQRCTAAQATFVAQDAVRGYVKVVREITAPPK